MKSVFRLSYGPPEILEIRDLEMPKPKTGQVLIRLRASTVNRTDCGGLWGRPFIYRFFAGFPRPRYLATGSDFAGDILALGEGVENFAVGDRVFGFNDNGAGSHAEFFVYNVKQPISKIPEGISYEDAAASLEGAHYARNFCNKVSLKPGDWVLVNGATSAIGSALVQILKDLNVQVTGVCATEHVDKISALGADRVVDYLKEDFTKEAVEYDYFFDAVGKSTLGQCRQVLKRNGIYISSELGPWSQNIFLSLLAPFVLGPKVVFPMPLDIFETLKLMTRLLEERKFKPLIDRYYSISQIQEAFTYVDSGQKIGNVILEF